TQRVRPRLRRPRAGGADAWGASMRDLPSVSPGSHCSSPDRSKARIWRPTAMALAGVLLGAWTEVASAQQASVAGQVTDSVSRHPLVSAQVLVGGTTLRTLTDRAGRFGFDAVPAVVSMPPGPRGSRTRGRC